MLTMTRQEQTREHNRRAYAANEMSLEDHEKIMLRYAPEYVFPDDPAVLASVQFVIDGADRGGFVRYGVHWTDVICAAITGGRLKRARRSYSGMKELPVLNLPMKTA